MNKKYVENEYKALSIILLSTILSLLLGIFMQIAQSEIAELLGGVGIVAVLAVGFHLGLRQHLKVKVNGSI